ncbi:hypothetical protein ACOXXX_21410 [Thalassococcus sp. BH17M4-6]|uniref:hypothetical protein n=1 Tax=Thalassococcus sp. BH17M4-6 TaxID=3413148 RepID=UPI003BC14B6E
MKLVTCVVFLSLFAGTVAGQTAEKCVPNVLFRQGLRIGITVCPEDPPVDVQRIKEQRERDCGNSDVRFGDVALMRGSLDGIEWSRRERRALSTAALSDDLEVALGPLRESIDQAAGTGLKETVLIHQAALTALQFQDPQRTKVLLDGVTLPADAPKDVIFDQVFLGILADAQEAGAAEWAAELLPRIDTLKTEDTSAFGLRAWRLYGWFLAKYNRSFASCDAAIDDFMTRVLDVSEASSCPLLLGHFEHALDRRLQSASATRSTEEAQWRLLAGGVLASVSGRDDAALVAQAKLDAVGTLCAPRLSAALTQARTAVLEVGQ